NCRTGTRRRCCILCAAEATACMSPKHRGIKLWKTTVFRLSMVYAVSFWLVTLTALVAAYKYNVGEVNKQINAGLRGEVQTLQTMADQLTLPQLAEAMATRSTRESLLATDLGDPGPRFYLLVDSHGRYLAGSMPHWRHVLALQGNDSLQTIKLETPAAIRPLVEFRDQFAMRSYQLVLPGGARLLVGQGLNELADLRQHLSWLIAGIIVFMISAGTLGGWWIGRTVVRSLDQVMLAADRTMAGDMSQRIRVDRKTDEFALLAQRLNLMLERIENLMDDLRDVTENVAHDLRTPLTRLRAHSEVALAKTDEEETARALQTVIQQSEALIRILEAIMSIAQVEAGSREDWQQVDVVGICADIIEFYEPLAEEQLIELTARFSDEAVSVTGSEQLLTQAIGNLVDNAIKYTPPGSDIRL